jgi:hypothetical protein
MNNHLDINQKFTITLPITEAERQIALNFSQPQHSKQKQQQVYLNTLAVLVVQNYLKILEIDTQLESSYSWNPIYRFSMDTADLKIIDHKVNQSGHLECRPVKAEAQFAEVPAEVWDERIGYMFVQFDAEYHQGTLLGFLPEVSDEQIPLTQIEALPTFLDFLYQPAINWVRLNDWFEHIFSTGWQAVEEVINNKANNPQLAFRFANIHRDKSKWLQHQLSELKIRSNPYSEGSIPIKENPIPALVQIIQTTDSEETRWKAAEMLWEIEPTHPAAGARRIIDLAMRLGGNPVALMVALLQKPDYTVAILLRVYPLGSNDFLPAGLKLAVSDFGNSNSAAEVQSRFQPLDNYIQLKLTAISREKFTVKVSLDKANFIEHFVI